MSEQIRMSTCAVEDDFSGRLIDLENKQPVRLNMTLKSSCPFTMQRVFSIYRRKGLFTDDHIHNSCKFVNIHTAFFHQFILFSERFCIYWSQHELIVRIVPFKIFQHFLKRVKPLCGNFTPQYCAAFFYSSNSLGIITRIPGYRIAVFGADGALICCIGSCFICRSKGKYHRSQRHLRRNIKSNPAAGRYLYCLFNGHDQSIPLNRKIHNKEAA